MRPGGCEQTDPDGQQDEPGLELYEENPKLKDALNEGLEHGKKLARKERTQ